MVLALTVFPMCMYKGMGGAGGGMPGGMGGK